MSLFVASLNSGSNGNCYYIGNREEAVLIDAGISCRETEQRMKRLELSMKRVKGIFVSHEHADHISGVSKLSKKFDLPVYVTESTRVNGRLKLKEGLAIAFVPDEPVRIGALTITAFQKFHDASDPHSFVVNCQSVNVGVFTDIGRSNDLLAKHFALCHAAFLESNYDEHMLETGTYPLTLKNRIRNGHGHLSNTQALQLFLNHRPPFMSHLFLSHLSENNNSPRIVRNLFKGIAGSTEIVIAPRDKETAVYHIDGVAGHALSNLAAQQLSLF